MEITVNYSMHNNTTKIEIDDKYEAFITSDISYEEWKKLQLELVKEIRNQLPKNACMVEYRRTKDYAPLNIYSPFYKKHLTNN